MAFRIDLNAISFSEDEEDADLSPPPPPPPGAAASGTRRLLIAEVPAAVLSDDMADDMADGSDDGGGEEPAGRAGSPEGIELDEEDSGSGLEFAPGPEAVRAAPGEEPRRHARPPQAAVDPLALPRSLGLDAQRLHRMREALFAPDGPPASSYAGGGGGGVGPGGALGDDDFYFCEASGSDGEGGGEEERAARRAARVDDDEEEEEEEAAAEEAVPVWTRRQRPFHAAAAQTPAPATRAGRVYGVEEAAGGGAAAGSPARDGRVAAAELDKEFEATAARLPEELPESMARGRGRDRGLFMRRSFGVGWGPGGVLCHSYASAGGVVFVKRIVVDAPAGLAAEAREAQVQSDLCVHLNHYSNGAGDDDGDGDAAAGDAASEAGGDGMGDDDENEDMGVVSAAGGRLGRPVAPLTRLCNSYASALRKLPRAAAADQHGNGRAPGAEDATPPEYAASVWRLVKALWSPELGAPLDAEAERGAAPPGGWEGSREEHFARRAAVGAWLRDAVADEVRRELAAHAAAGAAEGAEAAAARSALSLLTGHRVERACEELFKAGDHRLAVLVAQAGEDPEFREDLRRQGDAWAGSHVADHMDRTRSAVYRVLAGECSEVAARPPPGLALSWLRRFGLFLWFGRAEAAGLVSHAVEAYAAAAGAGRLGEAGADLAPPPYAAAGPARPRDVRFSLLRLYCDRREPQAALLAPRASARSLLDHHLPWHLHDALHHTSCAPFARAHDLYLSYAAQLEAAGLWHWAVYVLMYGHARRGLFVWEGAADGGDAAAQGRRAAAAVRRQVVLDLLCRNCPETERTPLDAGVRADTFSVAVGPGAGRGAGPGASAHARGLAELLPPAGASSSSPRRAAAARRRRGDFGELEGFLARVGVPAEWVSLAKAQRARYDGAPHSEVTHLLAAGRYDEAHDVLCDRLAPRWLLQEATHAPLRELLARIGARQPPVRGWGGRGAIYLEYLRLVGEVGATIRSLAFVEGRNYNGVAAEVPAEEIARLGERVAVLSRALRGGGLDGLGRGAGDDGGLLLKVAASEMAARLSNFQRALDDAAADAAPAGAARPSPEPLPLAMTENDRVDRLQAMCAEYLALRCGGGPRAAAPSVLAGPVRAASPEGMEV